MKIANLREAAMEWTVTIEGPDEFGEIQRAQVQIEKGFERLASGEIGLSIDDGKRIMSALQEFVVKEQLATYALARRVCVSCERLRPVKDYTSRKIRTVFGTVVVKNPRWMVCQRCFPHFSMAFTVLGEICPDRATPELMELTARLGSMLPYRKAAELLAEFLPIEPTEGHQTVRKRTLTLGARLEDQSLRQVRETPPLACERKQLELGMPDDPLREFVVSIDTAHIRSADQKTARDFEIVIARCGRGGRGMPPGHYFATSNTSQLEMRARTLQALQFEGYSGHGEVTILSDGAEIMSGCQRRCQNQRRILSTDGVDALYSAASRCRVEMWRGGCRSDISVPAPFVWRCLTSSTMAPFPHPAHRTGQADFPHPALGQDVTPSHTARRI